MGSLVSGAWASVPYSEKDTTNKTMSLGTGSAGYYEIWGVTVMITPDGVTMPPNSEQLVSVTYKPAGAIAGVSYHWTNVGFAGSIKDEDGKLVGKLWIDANTNSVILQSNAQPWDAGARCEVWTP